MENGISAGELALLEQKRGIYDGEAYGYRRTGHGMAATGLGLACGLGGAALLFAIAGVWGVNQASKARSDGNANTMNAQAKANADLVALLANRVTEESTRANSINIDVAQTLRNLTGATATGGTSSAQSQAFATAEALALLNQTNSNPLTNAIQQNCALRVQRVATQDCGCGCNG
jgi:hypothetical protein